MVQEISEFENGENGARPVIVNFQNSELQEGEEGKLKTGIFKKSRKNTLVAIATRNNLHVGEIDNDSLNKRYLLVSNRRTGKVRIVAVDEVTVSRHYKSPKKSKTVDENDSSVVTLNTTVNQLYKEFGSKKIKRITEQRERLKMNIDDVKEQLEQTVAGVEMNESESFITESVENDSLYRPPINRNASRVEQVYVLNDLVPEFVLDSLEEEANGVLMSDLESVELCSFVKDKLGELQNSSDDDVTEKAKLLLYIDYLIKYITKPAKNITKRFVLCQSNEVNSHILDNFSVTSNNGRTRPLSMRDKTICYILVLAMIAFKYELDVESLSKNIKIGVKKLQEMGRILAFSSHSKNKNLMTLKIPLPPAVSISPKKRKR